MAERCRRCGGQALRAAGLPGVEASTQGGLYAEIAMQARAAVGILIRCRLRRHDRPNHGLTQKILAQDDDSGIPAMRRPVVGVIGNAYRVENRFADADGRRAQSARGRRRRRRAAADVCRLARNHRYRRAAGCRGRRGADRRPRQCSSDPLRTEPHERTSPTTSTATRRAGAVGSLRRARHTASSASAAACRR